MLEGTYSRERLGMGILRRLQSQVRVICLSALWIGSIRLTILKQNSKNWIVSKVESSLFETLFSSEGPEVCNILYKGVEHQLAC